VPNQPAPPQPAVYKLQQLSLDALHIKANDTRHLLEALCDTHIETLQEIKLTNFSLNDDKAVAHLGELLRAQTNLAILNLSYTSLRATQLLELSTVILEADLTANFVELNLSFNNAAAPNPKV
jgi:hypothetical protein